MSSRSSSSSLGAVLAVSVLALFGAAPLSAQEMTVFVTDEGIPGMGDSPDRLSVADQMCEHVAYASGAGDFEWRAYLDGPDPNGSGEVRARDRIGSGPWHNHRGTPIAENVEDLHGSEGNLSAETALRAQGGSAPAETPEIPAGPELDGSAFSIETPFLCFASN